MDLIKESEYKRFPPRLFHQPIFYPVLNREYAIQIARDWNTKDPVSDFVGYVTRFEVRNEYIKDFEVKIVGAQNKHEEYWIPAEDLERFNDNIVGFIEVIDEFRGEQQPQ